MTPSELHHPPRPEPPRRWSDTATMWLAWIGPWRLVATALSVAVVLIGVAWLVRVPAAPTESGLPVAGSGATLPTSAAATLPPPTTLPSTTVATDVVVHVAGEVARPGVHELAGVARVADAIERAGGPTADADLDGLNLAAGVVDGQRIYVPADGEIDPASVSSGTSPASAGPDVAPWPIDLNEASASELERLPGVGPATAAAIVDDRERNGPFATVDDLDRVPGIGPARLAAVADLVTV